MLDYLEAGDEVERPVEVLHVAGVVGDVEPHRGGMLAGNLDEEDRAHAEFKVERPRECEPVTIEVKFTNYKSPQPHSVFDARGRLVRTR